MKLRSYLALLALSVSSLSAATHTVNSVSSLNTLLSGGTVQPGDMINWTNGSYSGSQSINFQGVNGTSSAPITLRAATPGGVTFTGAASVRLGGNWLVLEGFRFTGTETSTIIQFRSSSNVEANNCRVTDCAIISPAIAGSNTSKWVQIYGTNNRVDHCTFTGKRSRGALLVVELGSLGATQSANHIIEYNHLADFPQPAGETDPNEYEGMRIGFSGDQDKPANCIVRYNLFVDMDADPESISNKSSGNQYLYNTFRSCASQVVSRHGDNCVFAGNFILGEGKAGAGGIRIVGTGHDIYNNYISGLRTSSTDNGWFTAIGLMSGSTSAPADGYERVSDVMVFHNTIVDCDIPIVVGEGHNTSTRTVAPTNCLFANNLISSTRGTLITHTGSPTSITYSNNIGHGSAVGISATSAQVNTGNPNLALSDGLQRPSTSGIAANTATGSFPEANVDIDGQTRPSSGKDIGSDEVSGQSGSVIRRPLTTSDVGASYLGGPGGGDTTPTITTTSLPGATVGTAYNQTLGVTSGESPFTWSISAGALPAGLSLGSSTGAITGTPTTAGTANFTARVQDSDGDFDTQALSIVVSAAAQVATPTFSPAGGTYSSAQSVTISTTTSGATIRYTTNGTNPTSTTGTVYSSAVSISTTMTLKAIAYKSGSTDSAVATANYTISTSDPEIVPVASSDSTPWDTAGSNGPANLWDGDTADGGNDSRWASNASPSTLASSPRYVVLDLGASYNISKFVVHSYQSRAYHHEIYVSATNGNWGTAIVNVQPSSGAATYPHNVTATGRYVRLVVDGISGTTTTWASINELDIFGTAAGGGTVANPSFSPAGGTFTSTQNVTISTATSGATIRYTTNGTNPTSTTGTVYSGPVNVAATTTLKAIAYKSGMTDSAVASATYTINSGGGTLTRREAESYNSSTGGTFTLKNDAGASNGQFIDFPTANITATYTNNPSTGGSRTVTFRYRNGDSTGTNRTMTIALNGGTAVTVTFPGNGNWSSFQTTTATVTFANSATNSVVLGSSNAPDLDYFEYNQ